MKHAGTPSHVHLWGQHAGVTHGVRWQAAPRVIPSVGTATANALWLGAPAASVW